VAFLSFFTQTFLHCETYYYENCRGQGAGASGKSGGGRAERTPLTFRFLYKKRN